MKKIYINLHYAQYTVDCTGKKGPLILWAKCMPDIMKSKRDSFQKLRFPKKVSAQQWSEVISKGKFQTFWNGETNIEELKEFLVKMKICFKKLEEP